MARPAVHRDRLREALATLEGAAVLLLPVALICLVVALMSVACAYRFGLFAPSPLLAVPENLSSVKYGWITATNLVVLVTCGIGFLASILAVVLRYIENRDKIELIRSRGITDFDGDGNTDSFADKFLDDL